MAIILNESGNINGLPLNRAIYTEDGDMQDIYAGDFLVVGLTEDDFGSLTSEQMQDTIIRLLEKWQRSKQRDMER